MTGVQTCALPIFHADKHGFLVIPEEDQEQLLDAARFMDENECRTMIQSARSSWGNNPDVVLADFNEAVRTFGEAAKAKFGKKGEC